MVLIAESGSTKTHWCLIEQNKKHTIYNSPGINPLVLTETEVANIISPISKMLAAKKLSSIHFYGAGCSTIAAIEKVKTQLSIAFKSESVHVDTDLKAACLALAGTKKGIIGILGTGSNSCYWNGIEIESKIPSLGYILGDEGGGVAIGKQLIADYLRNKMPADLSAIFAEKYQLTASITIDNVYRGKSPNGFIASFAPFINDNFEHEYCQQIINNQFELFFENNILRYTNAREYDIYFCGSIAYHYKDILKRICKKHELKLSLIIKEPIHNLINYYSQKMT